MITGRTMPITFGTGAGLGMAYSNCQNDLRTPYLLYSNATKVSISFKGSDGSSYFQLKVAKSYTKAPRNSKIKLTDAFILVCNWIEMNYKKWPSIMMESSFRLFCYQCHRTVMGVFSKAAFLFVCFCFLMTLHESNNIPAKGMLMSQNLITGKPLAWL